jgi:hypothetical protein
MGKGVGFSAGGEIGRTGLLPCEGRSPARGGRRLPGGTRLSVAEGKRHVPFRCGG